MTDFVHLHLHTEYSLLDGACSIHRKAGEEHSPLIARALELGQKSLAITDHGVMFGVIDFYRECKAAGIHPVIGCEVYTAPRTMRDKTHEYDSRANHLVLLAKNQTGYKNLMKIVSLAHTEGFYIKPRCDTEVLRAHAEGIIALSACLSGAIPSALLRDDYEGARSKAAELKEIFGENFYIEIQDHGLPEQRRILPLLVKLARELSLPLVATNDVHYIEKTDAETQQVLMCIQTGKTVDDAEKMSLGTEEFYLKSGDEMAELFPEYPEAIANTVKIAEMCNVEFEFGKLHLPAYATPEGETAESYLRRLTEEGFARRYGEHPPEGARERMEYEFSTIRQMGYVDYFLIVWDFIHFAKSHDIPVGPGRGSAAGSIVAYCLEITDVEPLGLGLLFERFLNPERVTMPDIDVDFCVEGRERVIDYVAEKYGHDHVAQIVTFGTMLAKGAVRDVGRALGMPYGDVDTVAKLIPNELKMTIDKALSSSKQLRDLYEQNADVHKLIDMARRLEGMPRHSSTHAAGIVITGEEVSALVPLIRSDDFAVTQFTMGTLEELGLLKMDFLGLRNLTVINEAEKMIGGGFSVAEAPLDDPAVYRMLAEGHTSGIFQLESGGMKNVLMGMRPRSIEDIIAVISLYRPGPMDSIPRYIDSMHHPEHVRYKHPMLEEILSVTYGCIVYQEQVMQIVRKMAGYSYGRADLVRRAMSKKKASVMEKEREYFIHGLTREDGTVECVGAVANGVPEAVATDIFDEMTAFAEYAFNKSHAAAYAIVSYRTAYLKAHYPAQYMAALLTSILDSPGKVSEYIAECQRMGIRVLPPDINQSGVGFTVTGKNIRFGLVAIKNIGYGVIEAVIRERERGGAFRNLYDFLNRMCGGEINKKAIEGLIISGAFDSFGVRRSQMLRVYEAALDEIVGDRKRNVEGQIDLFGGTEEQSGREDLSYPDIPELPEKEKLALEKAATGLYLSGHPLEAYAEKIAASGARPIGESLALAAEGAGETLEGEFVTLAGIVMTKRIKTTRSGSVMAFLGLEDMSGSIECLVFPKVLLTYQALCEEGAEVVLYGRLSAREDEEPKFIVEKLRSLDGMAEKKKPKRLYLRFESRTDGRMELCERVLGIFGGGTPLVYYYGDEKKYQQWGLERGVEPCEPVLRRLSEILGAENVVYR